MNTRTAVIDIGSNSVRLLWGRRGALGKKSSFTTQLSEGLDACGRLGDAAQQRTLEAIAALAEQARSEGAETVCAFATEAVRAAANGPAFAERVTRATGVPIEILDGETEARCGWLGALGDTACDALVGVIDIGGASAEVTVGRGSDILFGKSLPIGVVRLKERYGVRFSAFDADLGSLIAGYGDLPRVERVIGIGGTPTTAAAMHAGLRTAYEPETVHGAALTLADLRALTQLVRSRSTERLMEEYPMLVRRRAEVIGYGFALLAALTERLGCGALTVSETDNLEGYLALLSARAAG